MLDSQWRASMDVRLALFIVGEELMTCERSQMCVWVWGVGVWVVGCSRL